MSRRRRQFEVFSLSFLDVISCGFGAIILLLVISKISEPRVIEQTNTDLSGLVIRLEEELYEIRGETQTLNRHLIARQEQLSEHKEKLARLQGALTDIEGQYRLDSRAAEAQSVITDKLESARQELTDEMRRLNAAYQRPKEDAVIGGVPVDSEYIIFVIDTSGSMQRFAWPLVRQKMKEILDIYPRVKGVQVLNDMGDYMFSQYAGNWIP
ncbi:MAG: VWA domain-containing protein, partial [Desulfuromonadales bacterium]